MGNFNTTQRERRRELRRQLHDQKILAAVAAWQSRIQPVAPPPVAPPPVAAKPSYDNSPVAEAKRRIEAEKQREIKKLYEEDVADQIIILTKNSKHVTRIMREERKAKWEELCRAKIEKLEAERQVKKQQKLEKDERNRQAAEKRRQESILANAERMKKLEDERIKRAEQEAEEEAQKKRYEESRKAEEEAERLQIIKDADDYIDNALKNGMYSYKDVATHEVECAKMDRLRDRLYTIARTDFFDNKNDPKLFRFIVENLLHVSGANTYLNSHPDDSGFNHLRAMFIGKIVECGDFAAAGVSRTWGGGQHEWNYKWLRHHHLSYCGYCKSCPFGRDTTPFG